MRPAKRREKAAHRLWRSRPRRAPKRSAGANTSSSRAAQTRSAAEPLREAWDYGFDAWQRDPLAGMKVTEEGYASWGRWLGELADRVCEGRLLSMLEGGYDLEALPRLVTRYLRGTLGE